MHTFVEKILNIKQVEKYHFLADLVLSHGHNGTSDERSKVDVASFDGVTSKKE